jgi:hypothetical protein
MSWMDPAYCSVSCRTVDHGTEDTVVPGIAPVTVSADIAADKNRANIATVHVEPGGWLAHVSKWIAR